MHAPLDGCHVAAGLSEVADKHVAPAVARDDIVVEEDGPRRSAPAPSRVPGGGWPATATDDNLDTQCRRPRLEGDFASWTVVDDHDAVGRRTVIAVERIEQR